MSLPGYAEYKDSGVKWLGKVPAHWTLSRLKQFARFSGGGTPSRDVPAFWNGDIPWVSPKDMKVEVIVDAEERITPAGLEGSSSNRIAPGHVLMVVRSGILKHTIPIAINDVPVALNQDMKALRFEPTVCDSRFFLRWVQGLNDALLLAWAKQGATVESIEHAYLAETVLPLPSVAEQTAIVTFLDRETAQIDALINEQEKLIGLLVEKRQATISHAVTRGLNPDAPMKNSCVARLGEMPVHWETGLLKRYWSVTDCKHLTAEFVDDGIPLASIREVQSRYVSLDEAKRTTETFYWQLIEGGRQPTPGDLIFSRNATVGEVAQVTEAHPPFAMGQDVCLLRKRTDKHSSDYMQAVIRSSVVVEQLKNVMVGSTFKRVNVEEIRGLVVPMPPSNEQIEIAAFIATEAANLDRLVAEAERAIALLKERRRALIAAAVTGHIDVSGKSQSSSKLEAIAV